MSVANRISLYMDLRSGGGFNKANTALHRDANHVIVRKSPCFHTNGPPPADHDNDLTSLKAIGSMTNLTRLDLVDFEGGDLSAHNLAILLQTARNLQVLKLASVHVVGSHQDFGMLVEALKSHPSLSELFLSGCLPHQETTMTLALAEALACLETLKVVEIMENRFSPCGSWTGKALAALCQSPSLVTLRIQGVRFLRDSHIVLMAQSLIHNSKSSVLEELTLVCDIGDEAVGAICAMLRVHKSLQILSLNRIMNGDQASDIADALAKNTTLRQLRLFFRFCLVGKLQRSFLELLEHNYTLEKLYGGWTCSKLEFFLKLNGAGRKRLLDAPNSHRPTRSDWIDVMASHHHDLDILYYFLSQNPSLCS